MMRPHRRANNHRIRELERNPLWNVTHADHTDDYPQPDEVNGHVPDYRAESIFEELLIGETERCGDNSQHTQSQQDTFGRRAGRRPNTSFELNEYGCETSHETEPDFGVDLDFGMDLGFDNKQSSRKKSNSGGLLDFF